MEDQQRGQAHGLTTFPATPTTVGFSQPTTSGRAAEVLHSEPRPKGRRPSSSRGLRGGESGGSSKTPRRSQSGAPGV
jgi:hypothetical protein